MCTYQHIYLYARTAHRIEQEMLPNDIRHTNDLFDYMLSNLGLVSLSWIKSEMVKFLRIHN